MDVNRKTYVQHRPCLVDGQGEGCAGSAAGAAEVAGVSAGGVDGNAGGSGAGDLGIGERGLQFRGANDLRRDGGPVDFHDRGRKDIRSRDGEKITFLYLRERDGGGGERRNGRCWPGASAEELGWIASWKKHHGEQQGAGSAQEIDNSFHGAIVHRDMRERTEWQEP